MRKVLFLLILLTLIVACGPKTYYECKNPVKTQGGKILCEK